MICRKCAWAGDTASEARWIEDSVIHAPKEPAYMLGVVDDMQAAAAEAHVECASAGSACDCQHWIGAVKLRYRSGSVIESRWAALPRCSFCYKRLPLEGDEIICHSLGALNCPGSGKSSLVKAIAPRATSSSQPTTDG